MMDRRAHKSYFKAPFGVFVLLLFEVLTVVHCAPQGNVDYYDYYEDYGEVFQQCADLKLHGYEGYECTPKSKCDEDGYIVNRVDLRKDGSVRIFQDNDRGNKELELSNYKCPKTMIRQDYEDYDNSSDDEMICCRKLEFYGNGKTTDHIHNICKNWEENGFDCVRNSTCEEDGHYVTLVQDEGALRGLQDVSILSQFELARQAKCGWMGDVCCRKDTFYNKPFDVPDTTSKTPEITTRQDVLPRDSLGQSTTSKTPDITTSQDLPPQISIDQDSRCGRRNQPKPDLLSPRIAGGDETEEATFGEWPHMCIILEHTQFDGDAFDLYQCGASLISPGIILTAAHCVAKLKLSDTKVRCGELDATSDDEEKPPQDRQAKDISVHPAFNAKNLYYDFALVHVATDFELDEHISPICLPDQFQPLSSFSNDECYVMGYGKDRSGEGGLFANTLKMAPISTVDSKQCEDRYRTDERPDFRLHKSFVCAQGDGMGTCSGDGGSPLVCPKNNGYYIQAGVVSWGEKDCGGDRPDVFADVSKAVGFIDWATKCVEGQDSDLFGLSGFKRWAKRQYCKNSENIKEIKAQLGLPDQDEVNLRREWRQYEYENNKFREAIKNCKTGPKDFDCSVKDYIASEQDFKEYVDQDDLAIEDDYRIITLIDYDDLLRSDVRG